jgi:hypothetical protein
MTPVSSAMRRALRAASAVARVGGVLLVLGAVAGCGRNGGGLFGDGADETIKAEITADVETPFLLGLTAAIPSQQLDANGILGQEAVLTTTALKEDQAMLGCMPQSPFKLLANSDWVGARLLQRLEGSALVRRGDEYAMSSELTKSSVQTRPHGEMCPLWYFVDMGHFKIGGIERINEFTAPDPQTLAEAKVRSYRVSATFAPSESLAAAAPEAKYGTFTWIVVLEQDPVALTWKFYKFDPDIRWAP